MPGRDSSERMDPGAQQPVLGATHGGLRIRLVHVDGDRRQSFVVLHEGRFARVLLAEIATDSGQRVRRFALKLQSDAYASRVKGHGRPLTNRDVDELWQRETAGLDGVSSPHVIARAAVPAGLLEAPPITYCSKVDRYFHPVCAETGLVLTVCRDDERLAANGLLPYSEDTWRYLHGSTQEQPSRVFYRVSGANAERPRDGVTVRIGNQLFRDWGRLVHAPAGDAAAARAAAVLPCLSCEHRAACHPAAAATAVVPAEEHLRIVSFHDFRAIALELQDFDYDELCTLLGGGAIDDVIAGMASTGRQALAQERAAALAGPGQWLFAGDPVRFAREVLLAKLNAFVDVCRGVRAVHVDLDRPHFGIAPSNVMATFDAVPGAAPVRWTARTHVIDLGSPLRFVPADASACAAPDSPLANLLEPGLEMREDLPNRPFVAPDVLSQDAQASAMSVAFRATPAGDGKVRLAAEAQGTANLKQFRPGDVVGLAPSGGADDATLWVQLEEIRARGFVAGVQLDAADPRANWNGKKLDMRASFHRRFGPPVDLHGLGMLLFRTLLVNDQQGMEDVAEAVAKCLRRLADDGAAAADERQITSRLRQMTSGKELRARFDAANVLHERAARDANAAAAGGGAALDPGIFEALLQIAFKLVTRVPGFSYGSSHAESSPFLLKQVAADLEALQQRVRVDLFAAGERDTTVAAVCREVLEQLRADLLSQPSLDSTRAGRVDAPSKGFRLVVEREGDGSSPQEFVFDRDQVTIGRREVENLVRLNDPMVSSAHALIEKQSDGFVVVDRNSTNGTEVDGIRLPGDVPQPLQDGTVIVIRPFRLTFHASAPDLEATSMVQTISTDRLRERMYAEYARVSERPAAERMDALRKTLQEARSTVGSAELHSRIEEIARTTRGGPAGGDDGEADVQAKFFASAHRSLAQLSRTLVGPGEFRTPEDVQAFAARLAKFVETTSQWIERTLDLRRALGKHLEVGATSTGTGRGGARTAAEVRQLALGWAPDGPNDPTGAFLAKFYDDLIGIVEGLLKGSQQVRRAVRERLDPQKLVDIAGREAKFGLLVNAAAGSTLWKLYTQVFQEVTEGKQFELELDRLLQKSLQDRAPGH